MWRSFPNNSIYVDGEIINTEALLHLRHAEAGVKGYLAVKRSPADGSGGSPPDVTSGSLVRSGRD